MLPNFPLVNQLHEPTNDRMPDENANWNCVPASISAGMEYLTRRSYNGDELKDAVYGQGYTGPMAASHFVDYCRSQGVALMPASGSNATLIAAVRTALAAGDPVLMTIPSAWNTVTGPTSGPTHVVIACGMTDTTITAMNPWGGFLQQQPTSWWEARLQYGQVWTMEGRTVITIDRDSAGNVTGAHDGGNHVGAGFAQTIIKNNWENASITVPETYLASGESFAVVRGGARALMTYSQANGVHTFDGDAVEMAQDLFTALQDAQAQIKTLQDKIASTPPPSPPEPSQYRDAIVAIAAALKVAS